MVSDFLPEALHTRKNHYEEGEKDAERWWAEILTTHLHFLSSSASEGRSEESREKAGGVLTGITNTVLPSVASVFGAITFDTWHPSYYFTNMLSLTFCWTCWIFLFSCQADTLQLVHRYFKALLVYVVECGGNSHRKHSWPKIPQLSLDSFDSQFPRCRFT